MEKDSLSALGMFTIRVKVGVIEIEIAAPDRDFVLDESNYLIEQFNLTSVQSLPMIDDIEHSNGVTHSPTFNSNGKEAKQESLAEFWRQFPNLQKKQEKTLVIGYWCEIKQEKSHFTAEEVQAKYKELRESVPSYIKRDLDILKVKGFLTIQGTEYSLTNTGIKEVESKMKPV